MTTGNSQVLLLGAISFCACGMVNSVNSLSGGIANQVVAGEMTVVQSLIFIASSFFTPIMVTFFGPRSCISFGCLACVLYILSIRSYKIYGEQNPLLCLLCAAIVGCGLAFFWTAHSVLIVAYPTMREHGRYIANFWSIYNCGAVLGGLLTFGTNTTTKSHIPSSSTFAAFSVVTGIGLLLSARLAPLDTVYRSDGVRVSDTLPSHSKEWLRHASYEVQLLFAMLMYDDRLHGLFLLFLYSNWFYAYLFGSLNFAAFNARSSGWNNFVYFCAQFAATRFVGKYLDDVRYTNHEKGSRSMVMLGTITIMSWLLAFAIELADPRLRDDPVDLITVSVNGYPVLIVLISVAFMAWGFCDTFLQIWCYWVMSELYHGPDFFRAVGVYKAVQACGAMCTWLCTLYHVPSSVMLHSNWVLFTLAFVPALRVCQVLSRGSDDADAELTVLVSDERDPGSSEERPLYRRGADFGTMTSS